MGYDVEQNKNIEEIKNIAAYELDVYMREFGNQALLIDVRDKEKYEQNHIEQAFNIPYRNILDKKVELPKEKIIVIYCDRGGLSMTIARYLHKKSYQVVNVIGGIKNYRKK